MTLDLVLEALSLRQRLKYYLAENRKLVESLPDDVNLFSPNRYDPEFSRVQRESNVSDDEEAWLFGLVKLLVPDIHSREASKKETLDICDMLIVFLQ